MRVPPFAIRRSEQLLFRYGLRRANAVIAQTLRQQHMLHETFGVTSTVIRSCSAWSLEVEEGTQPWKQDLEDRVLWVGRLSEEKRPDWVIQLATELPERRFDIVGQCNAGSEYGRILAGRIDSLPNVHWHGYVPHTKMRALYRQARLLLCTSESEGFPNVFLEAWSSGKAVLTSVDPDDVVTTFQLGQVATDYPAMRQHLAELDSSPEMWETAGRRGREYVRDYHSTAAAVDALEGVLRRYQESASCRYGSAISRHAGEFTKQRPP
jgi:glycosyltransferase involved in cell wall biosynthesis